jgi:hypothetical protein
LGGGRRFKLDNEKKRDLGGFFKPDRLVDYFLAQFDLVGWVDLEPIKIRPT